MSPRCLSGTDRTLKHPVNFRIKHVLTPDDFPLNFINNVIMCRAGPVDERFSEAVVALDSVITVKSRSLVTPAF